MFLSVVLACARLLLSAQLLPDGLLYVPSGMSGSLAAGLNHWSGGAGDLSTLAGRGVFAYREEWMAGGMMEVMSSRPGDSSLFTASEIGVTAYRRFGKSEGISSDLSMEMQWWTQTLHRDTGAKAIEESNSGLEWSAGVGAIGLGTRRFQTALGLRGILRVPVSGEKRGEFEPLLGMDASLLLDLAGIWPGVGSQGRSMGLFLQIPVEWSLLRPEPTTKTQRPFSAPEWILGLRGGVSIAL